MPIARFTPEIKFIASYRPLGDNLFKVLRKEQACMIHSGSLDYTRTNGGSLAVACLDILEERHAINVPYGKYAVIDTKVVMLMPGQYPCIPGWHCDAVERETVHSQPDLNKLDPDIKHFIYSLSTSTRPSQTMLMNQQLDVMYDPKHVWKSISENVGKGGVTYETGTMLRISQPTLHSCSPAKEREMRFFFRLSYYHKPPENKRRHQVQVYADFNNGW